MKKIGTTSSGTVIVEMSVAQFDALAIERVITGLQKSKFIIVDAADKVTYLEP